MATPVPQKDDVENWTVEQVAAWLQQVELSECCDIFLRKGIDGHKFLQLSEEHLFLWGRDVSIRNRKQILKLVTQIKNVQQHPSTTRPSIDTSRYNSQPFTHPGDEHEDYSDDDDDFSDDEYLEEDPVAQVQPLEERNVQGCHPPTRPPFAAPRNQCKENDGEEYEEDLYLSPIEPSSSTVSPSNPTPSKQFPGLHQPPNKSQSPITPYKPPWIVTKGSSLPKNPLPARGPIPTPVDRPPVPLPDQFTPSRSKQTPPDGPPLPSRPRVPNQLPFQGRNSNQNVVSEDGRSGGVGGSFLHRSQDTKPNAFTKMPWMSSLSQEKNDHVYETVGSPVAPSGGSGSPSPAVPDWQSSLRPPVPPLRNQHQDFDEQEMSSRLGAATISHKKVLPPLSRKQSGGGNNTCLVQPSPSGSPRQTARNAPPKPARPPPLPFSSSQLAHKIPCPESQAPPLQPQENQPCITLDNGKTIFLTSLYQKLMEKPFFHLISRAKAKTLMMDGEDGMFLIRPSANSGDPLSLTLKLDNRPYNISIRQRPDSLFALGSEKTQEKAFSTLDELISTYSREPIKLKNGKIAFLKNTPPKKGSIYVKHYPIALGRK